MNFKLNKLVLASLTSSFLLGFGANAMADSTFDLVQALVTKGVLTEEEALPLLKGRENDIQLADKKVKKAAKLGISDAIDNASIYGDMRVREEYRAGHDTGAGALQNKEVRDRLRYKLTFGVKSNAGDFYSDIAFAMGAGGRSDNSTFGNGNGTNGANNKETLFVKRAMLGWNVTDWASLEAGRIANPLYTTEMVWDKDLTMEGLAEKLNYTLNDGTELFGNFVQSQYLGDRRENNGTANDRVTNFLLAFQGGAKYKFNDNISAKAGLTYTKYTNNKPFNITGAFAPALGTLATFNPTTAANVQSTNNIRTIEVPAEVSFKTSPTGDIGLKLFGDYVYNIDGSDRYNAAVAATTAGAARNAIQSAGNDDTAWLLGIGAEMKQGKTPQKGDWAARLWYQEVGVYSVDPNAVDSDFFDSRVNMKGIVLKAEYNLRDNVFINAAAGHATRKNDALAAVGAPGTDLRVNIDSFDLLQLDLTYKF